MGRWFGVAMGLLLLALTASVAQAAQVGGDYHLRPEWKGPCRRAEVVDVNLGNSPAIFIRAAACQVSGHALHPRHAASLVRELKTDPAARRGDIVRDLCRQNGRTCRLAYSDPWAVWPDINPQPCEKRFTRDIGAVVMFFFHCPDGDNCAMGWAAEHVRGMNAPDRQLGGYYTADNAGFWRQQLRGAAAAGLQFILPNLYGPDMQSGQIDTLATALKAESTSVKVGLFDDTWAWGEAKFGAPWQAAPDLSDSEAAAKTLYDSKWRPFFAKIPAADWYRVDGRPLIYFYNAGTLKPANKAAAVLARMKAMFAAEFGIEPFVAVDDAFFADPDMIKVADSRFRWDTLAGYFQARDATVTVDNRLSRSGMLGRVMTNGFVRWDSHNRDKGAPIFAGRMIKGGETLQSLLDRTQGADSLLLQTWNDLGEGTGVSLAYDYYYKGKWLRPDHFMRQIRASNCLN